MSSNAPGDDTDCMGDSEMSYNARLNKLKSKMIQTRKAKIEAQLETSASEATVAIARDNSLKNTSTTTISKNVHEEEIQTQAFVDQLITEGPKRKSVSTPKTPYAGDSPLSSSNVPLNELKSKLSQIKSAKRETREKTACMGDSEMSSKVLPNMLMSKMVQTRKAKGKAQLETSALEATMAIASESSLKDISPTSLPQNVQEEEIQAQVFADQLKTKKTKGNFVVEQEQKVDQTGQTEKDVPSGSIRVDGPTDTDDKVAEILQHNPHLSEAASMSVLLADTNEIVGRPHFDEFMNENMPPSEFEEDASNLGSCVKVGQYFVHPSVSAILEAIINKYGDIAKDSICESNRVRSSLLESICKVFQGLQIPAKQINPHNFKKYYKTVKNADKLGVNVKWLHERLDKHLAKDLRDATKKNMELRDSVKKAAELKKFEVKELKHEIQELENQLNSEISEIKRLKSGINASASKSKLFREKGLMGGLI